MKANYSNLVSAVDVVRQISRARWVDVLLVVAGSLLVVLAAQVRVPVPGTDARFYQAWQESGKVK